MRFIEKAKRDLPVVTTRAITAAVTPATTAAAAVTTPATATATATAAAAVAAATTAAAAAAGVLTRAGFVDRQGPAVQFLAVHLFDGGVGFTGLGHFDEGETAAAAGFPVHHDMHIRHTAEGAERLPQTILSRPVAQIADIDTGHDTILTRFFIQKSDAILGFRCLGQSRPASCNAQVRVYFSSLLRRNTIAPCSFT